MILPDIPDDAPVELKNAIAVRNEASRTGRCPGCGAEMQLDGPLISGAVGSATMYHENECVAHDDAIRDLARRNR